MGNKANWEGVRVTEDSTVEADGGFVGDVQGDLINDGGTITIGTGSTFVSFRGDNVNIGQEGAMVIDIGAAATNVIRMAYLPTSDPVNADQLWNNSGVLSVSVGA